MEKLLDLAWPSKDKLEVQTQFYGTRRKPELRGSISNIGPANLTPQHLIAAFIEGMTDELYGFYSQLPSELFCNFKSVTGSGNAIRSNHHLRRVCAQRFAMPILLPAFREEASVGAALHAAVGLGLADGHKSAGSLLVLD
jgi:sedoheptulokinase